MKFTFLAFLLLALAGFGGWYGLVREDGGAGEIAQGGILSEQAPQGRSQEPSAPAAEAAEREAAQEEILAQEETVAQEDGPARDLAQDAAPEPATDETAQAPEASAAVSSDEAQAAAPDEETQVAAVEAQAPAVGEEPQAALRGARPVFDVVRVEPTGESVIAGRSVAGATVELLRNGVVHDRVVADASGAFAFIPPPFPAGSSEVVLRSRATDGAQIQSEQSVTIVVSADGTAIPMVAMVAPDQPTVVLSQPEQLAVAATEAPANAAAPALEAEPDAQFEPERRQIAAIDAASSPDMRQPVRIASVEAESGGGLYVVGEATPMADVRLYLNDTFIAPAEADGEGRVTFAIQRGVRPGSYRVRLDEVRTATGSVVSRAEIVFEVPEMIARAEPVAPAPDPTVSPEPAEQVMLEAVAPVEAAPEREATTTVPEIATALVERGDSLWRISRTVYGSGIRYTEIFEANREQIRNPDLIYPGQVFVLPPDMEAQGAAPIAPTAPETTASPD